MFLVCIVILKCHKTGWELLSMSWETVFLFISTFLLKIAISSCHFRGKNSNPSIWFHLYIAKCHHSGTPKLGHEVNVWIACYWNSKQIATDTGAERERGSLCSPPYLIMSWLPQRLALLILIQMLWLAGKGNGYLCGQEVKCLYNVHFFSSVIWGHIQNL